MSSYVVPQALIYQEFLQIAEAITQPLRACIVGPHYQLVRTAAEGALGSYDPTTDTCYSWPHRQAGGVVDSDAVRVFMSNALLQYFTNPVSTGDTIKATYCEGLDLMGNSAIKNAIRAAATNWVTYGAYGRDADLKERDVAVGDIVKVSAVVSAVDVVLWTYVAGFLHEKIAGVVGTAYEDTNNQGYPASESSSLSPAIMWDTISTPNSVDITAAATPPNVPEQGFIDGVSSDEYLIEVTTAGDYSDARLKITSASGTDDVVDVTPANWASATTFGNKGLSVTFDRSGGDVFVVGMAWELAVQFGAVDVTAVSSGAYNGPSDTTYVIEVTKGGTFGGALGNPEVSVRTTTGVDVSGPHEIASLSDAIDIGSYGVVVEFDSSIGTGQGLYLGDKYYIPVTAPAAGAVKTIVLGHDLPSKLLGLDSDGDCTTAPSLAVNLYIKKDIEVPKDRTGYAPLVNWTASATQVCLTDGILSYDSTWVDSGGTMLPLPVKAGSAYVYYRALLSTYNNAVGTISDVSLIPSVFGHTADPEDPLSMGVYMALLNSNGTAVKYISVATDDLAGYLSALGKLTQHDDTYNLTPMTFDTDVHSAFKSHALAQSSAENGRWRRTMLCTEVPDAQAIVDATDNHGSPVMATITDDPDSTGTQYTLLSVTSSVELSALGVQAGDIVRALYTTDGFGAEVYDEFMVDAVLSETSLRLLSGPDAPVTVAAKIEIWRDLSANELADAIAAASAVLASRRVSNVWPDYFEQGEQSLAGYYLAAGLAGARSGMAPQRGMTNTAINGVDSVVKTTEKFDETQLNTIAAGGTVIVTRNALGTVFVRHGLTTDMTDAKTREESITSNLDSISYFLLDQVAPYIGVANLTDQTIEQIRVELNDACNYLKNNGDVITVGGQLIDGSVASIQRHPTLSDRLVVVMNLTLPVPLNNIELHLVV